MTKLIHLAAKLYPRAWRQRYGSEFDALLEDSHPSFGDLLDIVSGAVVMQFTRSSLPFTAVAFALIGMAAAGLASIATHRRYESTVTISTRAESPSVLRTDLLLISPRLLNDASLSTLVEKFGLYADGPKNRPLAQRVEMFRSATTVMPSSHPSGGVTVSFQYPDRDKSAEVATAFAQIIVQENLAIQNRDPNGSEFATPVQMNAGPTQQARVRRRWIRLLGFGFLVGALAGVAVSLARKSKISRTGFLNAARLAAAFGALVSCPRNK